jgi:hypothetical protein
MRASSPAFPVSTHALSWSRREMSEPSDFLHWVRSSAEIATSAASAQAAIFLLVSTVCAMPQKPRRKTLRSVGRTLTLSALPA